MAYTRHDKDCQPAAAPLPYVRHDVNCDAAEELPADPADKDPEVRYQPSYTEVTDSFGNTYRNYNADYIDS